MKTSNKILLGLLIFVFTVPLLLASSLRSKIKKGEYTIQKNENTRPGSMRSGSFTAFKVVNVVAPHPDFLTCHLKLSDNMNYRYYNDDSKDSVVVFTGNDTLYIKYLAGKVITDPNERRGNNNLKINVNLPAFNNVVVDGAVVVIDSLSAALSNLSVTLKNKGVIKDGSENREDESAKVSPAVNIKEDKVLKGPETFESGVTSSTDYKEIEIVQKARSEIFHFDIKDLPIYGLIL